MPNIHPDLTLSFIPISWGLLVIRKFKPSGQSDEQRVGPSAVSWEARYQGFRMSSLSLGYIQVPFRRTRGGKERLCGLPN